MARQLHPRIVTFWHRLFRAVRIAVQLRAAVRVNEAPLPEIVCSFEDGNCYIVLPWPRLTYPGARLVPGKFEGTIDLAYYDNSKKSGGDPRMVWIDRRERCIRDRARSFGREPSSASKLAVCRCFPLA